MKKIYLIILVIIACNSYSQGTFTQLNDFPGKGGVCFASFSINGYGYSLGMDSSGVNFLWKYYPNIDTWKKSTQLPFNYKYYAITNFIINGKAYFYIGFDTVTNVNQLWEFNPIDSSWLLKNNFPGTPRNECYSFCINGKAYIGSGVDVNSYVYNDLWEYDPTNDQWTQKASLSGIVWYASSFVINNKAFICLGYQNNYYHSNYYSYDPAINQWDSLSPFLNTNIFFTKPVIINNVPIIYLSSNHIIDLYKYNSSSDTWQIVDSIQLSGLQFMGSFNINNVIYLFNGRSNEHMNLSYNKVYSYASPLSIKSINNEDNFEIYPNPTTDAITIELDNSEKSTISIININGQEMITKQVTGNKTNINISALPKGIYLVKVANDKAVSVSKVVKE